MDSYSVFDVATIQIGSSASAWGPFEFDFSDGLPSGTTINSCTVKSYLNDTESTSDLVESSTVTGDTTVQVTLDYPGTANEGSHALEFIYTLDTRAINSVLFHRIKAVSYSLTVEDGTSKTDADSYIGLIDANDYFESRLHTDNWDNATDRNRVKALKQATRILDRYCTWLGWQTDTDQALAWPRWGICYDGTQYFQCTGQYLPIEDTYSFSSDEVPQAIQDATCELALHLLGGDTQVEPDTAGYKSIEVEGAVSLEIDKKDRTSIIPRHVWDMVRHLGSRKGGATVNLMRG